MMDLHISNLIIKLGESTESFSLFDVITICISTGALLFSFLTFLANKKTFSENKKISLENEFIKKEASVLLEYREQYLKSQRAFDWFKEWLLTPRLPKHYVEEPLFASSEELRYYFNIINVLNNMYNINQHIFDKRNLEKTCNSIAKFLNCFQGYHFGDISLRKIEHNNKSLEYRPENFEQIVKDFLTNFQETETKEFNFETDYAKFKQYRNIFFEGVANLEFKLDEITLYNSGKNKTKRNLSSKKFFLYYKINNKQERTYSETFVNKKMDEKNAK